MRDDWPVRPARRDEAALLPAVETASGAVFRTIPDLAWLADGDVMPVAAHLAAIEAGTCWVVAVGDGIAGFLSARVAIEDGAGIDAGLAVLHVWEMSVTPAHQGRGMGRALLEHAAACAEAQAMAAVTLTTFRDVAWNAPFYARAGFATLPDAALTPRLRGVLAAEAAHGLPAARRCAMRRAVAAVF
ncbi:GNAT family N-acetyltransferase [Gluconacetobacter sacchari]|uniref:GNAT family N-acetyltransferase n=2 Tax=Gluconacetobacter sacchari TaxID=92759 RepID=A0A7W4IBL7_9PROT|nr:GNAT family N-acetyltransferase [Gluconacetobacter sacchari]MBB2159886.1 GNAT family N-acetyltransferase [Gluconacetobacter sacchari]GBQ26927.1 acetyltransferase [Gluconacetobacter sacchari DSM 12717]